MSRAPGDDPKGNQKEILVGMAVSGYTDGMNGLQAQIRKALKECSETRYRVAAETGISQSALSRFARGASVGGDILDLLAAHLNLELRKVKGGRRGKRG